MHSHADSLCTCEGGVCPFSPVETHPDLVGPALRQMHSKPHFRVSTSYLHQLGFTSSPFQLIILALWPPVRVWPVGGQKIRMEGEKDWVIY